MYKLREMDIDDQVCEQVDITILNQVYPKEEIENCVEESDSWKGKKRRVRGCTPLSLVWFVMAMALWSKLGQGLVWEKLVTKLTDIHPGEPDAQLSDSALSSRRIALGYTGLQTLMQRRCVVMATPEKIPSAFFGRYRLMAIDGTVFRVPDTAAGCRQHSVGAAINLEKARTHKSAVCSWPSVGRMPQLGSPSIVMMSPRFMVLTNCSVKLGQTPCSWWMQASPEEVFLSTFVHKRRMP